MPFLNIKWLGHAGFRISFSDPNDESLERVVYIDTWMGNPKIPADYKDKQPDDADIVLVTHGHFDHSTSAPDLLTWSKKEHCKIVANYEITLFYEKQKGIAENRLDKMNKGGTLDYGFAKVTMTTADHSSSCMCPNGDITDGGAPAGFVLTIPHLNASIYHAGDTNVFMDMELIEELNHPNILLIPIGDRFTMGAEGAAVTVSRFFKSSKLIFPMHFGTFPLLTGTFEGFKASLQSRNVDLSKLVNTPEEALAEAYKVDLDKLAA